MLHGVLLLACAGELKPLDPPDTAAAFGLASLAPTLGPASGGTVVTVRGEGFDEGTRASLGGADCTTLTFVSPRELACVTPPGQPGAAELVVAQGSERASLPWTYVAAEPQDTGTTDTATTDTGTSDTSADTGAQDTSSDTGATDTSTDTGVTDTSAGVTMAVDYCHLQWPCTMTLARGTTSPEVYAWVYQGGVTVGAGAGTGVDVQLGFGPDGTSPVTDARWSWSPMTYNADKDGLSAGDLANDEYGGTFVAPEPGAWDYCARVSVDGGRSWTACDAGGEGCPGRGSDDGYAPASAGQLTVR